MRGMGLVLPEISEIKPMILKLPPSMGLLRVHPIAGDAWTINPTQNMRMVHFGAHLSPVIPVIPVPLSKHR